MRRRAFPACASEWHRRLRLRVGAEVDRKLSRGVGVRLCEVVVDRRELEEHPFAGKAPEQDIAAVASHRERGRSAG